MRSTLRVQTTILPGHRIEIVSPELPEGGRADVLVVLGGSAGSLDTDARDLMQLPLEARRRILAAQAEALVGHYDDDPDRELWQGGDILEK